MRVLKQHYKSKGKTQQTKAWYVEIRDGDLRHRIPAYTDQKSSEEFGRKVERLASCKAAKLPPDVELTRWIEGLDSKVRARLEKLGLLERHRAAAGKKLTVHVEDFKAALLAKGNTPHHVKVAASRVKAIMTACRFVYWSDIDANQVQGHLAELRKPKSEAEPGLSVQTSNYYLKAFKQFCNWMVRERRASESPIKHLQTLNANADRRRIRRALTVGKFRVSWK